jgi:MoaA/NifB/PqqE/SkfB family radical SAM enzyme
VQDYSQAFRAATGVFDGSKNLLLRKIGTLQPKYLVFETTDLCNSRCTMCNIWQNKKTHEPLSPEEIYRVLSDPLFKNVKYIINTGGESTVRNDIVDVFKAEHKALPEATLQLSTNGLLPDRAIKVVEYCISNRIHIDVGVSLDGIGEMHDKIRGVEGNFNKVDDLVTRLLELRAHNPNLIKVSIGTTLIDETVENYNDVKNYAAVRGLDFIAAWYNNASFYGDIPKKKENNTSEVRKIVESMPRDLVAFKWLKWLNGESIRFTCFSLYTFALLKSNGDIVPCLSYDKKKIGNVRESTPTEIWHSENAKSIRHDVVKPCSGCLNNWATGWSFSSSFFPRVREYFLSNK